MLLLDHRVPKPKTVRSQVLIPTTTNQLNAFIGLLGLPAALDVENFIEVGLLYTFTS